MKNKILNAIKSKIKTKTEDLITLCEENAKYNKEINAKIDSIIEQNKQTEAKLNSITNEINSIKDHLSDLQNLSILKILFPDIFENMLPDYSFLKNNNFLYNAMERSYFQSEECAKYRNILSSKLLDITEELYKVTGGITSIQSAQLRAEIIEKNINISNNIHTMCNRFLAAHSDEHNEFKLIYNEIQNGKPRNWSEYFYRRYFALCEAKNDKETAKKVFEYYLENFGIEKVKANLPLSSMAYDLGYQEEIFKKANFIYNHIRKSEKENLFAEIIKNKSIALVGNGPQQNGRKTGKEIDSHNIVIRFNRFANEEQYKEDLGEKTDIWVGFNKIPLTIRDTSNISYYILGTDIYNENTTHEANPDLWDNLYDFIEKGGKVLSYPYDIRKEVADLIHIPTSGFLMIYWIKKNKPEFDKSNCYAFAFLDENQTQDVGQTWVHFDQKNYKNVRMNHSLAKEKVLIDKILNTNT